MNRASLLDWTTRELCLCEHCRYDHFHAPMLAKKQLFFSAKSEARAKNSSIERCLEERKEKEVTCQQQCGQASRFNLLQTKTEKDNHFDLEPTVQPQI